MSMSTYLIVLAVYLIGSLSSAILISRLMHLPDPRTAGSGNPGATNILRIGGKLPAALTLLGDVLKSAIPLFIAKACGFSSIVLAFVATSAVIGHLFPIFFHFKGGKGVATFLGALIALSPLTSLCWLATWLFIIYLSRYVSLASLIAALSTPLYLWFITKNMSYTIAFALLAVLVAMRHRKNIQALLAGKERKLQTPNRSSSNGHLARTTTDKSSRSPASNRNAPT